MELEFARHQKVSIGICSKFFCLPLIIIIKFRANSSRANTHTGISSNGISSTALIELALLELIPLELILVWEFAPLEFALNFNIIIRGRRTKLEQIPIETFWCRANSSSIKILLELIPVEHIPVLSIYF